MAENYEFTEEENRFFAGLAGQMKSIVYPLMLFAVMQAGLGGYAMMAVKGWGYTFPIVSFLVAFGCSFLVVHLRKTAASLLLVVDTEGSDIAHLMTGLRSMQSSIYSGLLIAWMVTIGLFAGIMQRVTTL